jgi:flagellar biosynthesis GTPase FlhF
LEPRRPSTLNDSRDNWDSPGWKQAIADYHRERLARESFPENLLRIDNAPFWEELKQQKPNAQQKDQTDWQASDPTKENDDVPASPLIKTSKQFVTDFVPPDYIVDGLLQEGFLYSLTGSTGAGKTAITLRLAASTALGVLFAGRETKRRRVLYLAADTHAL